MRNNFFLSISLGIFLLFICLAENTQAAFNCDSGSLSTTCYVTTTQTITATTSISGGGNLVIQSGGNISCVAATSSSITMTGDVTIESGGTITCNLTNLSAANLDVQSGGTINLNAKGYAGGTNAGNGSGTGYGAGYGGSGTADLGGGGGGYGCAGGNGMYLAVTVLGGIFYGSTTEPVDFGSGGGSGKYGSWGAGVGGNGGGAIKLNITNTVTLNGSITANGGDGTRTSTYGEGGGGSGGSIYINATSIIGSGTTTVNGGNAAGQSFAGGSSGGAGGGGRIAFYYTVASSTIAKQAFGGGTTGYRKGGAGTIFSKATTDTNGSLILDNNNVQGVSTTQATTTLLTVDNLTIKNGAIFHVPTLSTTTIVVAFTNSSATSILNVVGTLNLPASSLNFSGAPGYIYNNGTINNANSSFTIANENFTNNGAITGVTNLTISTTTLYSQSNLDSLTDLTIGGGSTFEYQNLSTTTGVTLNSLTIQRGGTLTHITKTSSSLYALNLTVNNLDVQSGGYISVNGKGHVGGTNASDGSGPGYGSGFGTSSTALVGGGGGGYGGSGGNGNYLTTGIVSGGSFYGSTTEPVDFGSGGGSGKYGSWGAGVGGNGGGIIKLNITGTLTLNGFITTNGNDGTKTSTYGEGGGGSGGSIYIIAGIITGTGTTTANGGNGAGSSSGAGGGGRIYINATNFNYTGTIITAYGGATGYRAGNIGTFLPYRLVFNTQPGNTVAGQTFNAVAVIKNLLGATVASSTDAVIFSIGTNPGGGTLSGTANYNATSGVATSSGLSINRIGTGYTLVVSGSGMVSTTSNTFNITVATASKLVFSQQPSGTSTAGTAFTIQPIVLIQDAYDNIVTTASDTVTMYIANNPGAGTLSGTVGVAAVSGTSTFTNLSINKIGTGYTLVALATGLTSATSSSFNITSGSASKLVFSQQPSSTSTAGVAFVEQPIILVQDAYDNVVTTASDTVTMYISNNPGAGTLSGTAGVSAVSGTSTFTNLSINKTGIGYTLVALATGLTSATSSGFNITSGTASKLVFSQEPSGTSTANIAFTIQPVVLVQDAYDNVVSSSTDTVTIAIATNPNTGTLSGTASVAPVSGTSTFTGLSINKLGTGYTLVAVATGLTSATSGTFNIGPGTASVLVVTGITSPLNTGTQSNVTVTAQDVNGYTAPDYTGTIHFTSSDTSATLPSDYIFQATDSGIKTFTNGIIFATAGIQTVTTTDTVTSTIAGFQAVTVNAPVVASSNSNQAIIMTYINNPSLQVVPPPVQPQSNQPIVTIFSKISCSKLTQTIQPGETSSQVRCLQEFLKSQGISIYPEAQVTGFFGPATKRAVIRFQEKYFDEILKPWGLLKGNGSVGPSTMKKINFMLGNISATPTIDPPAPIATSTSIIICKLTQTIKPGETSSQVRCLQEFLKSQGISIYPEAQVTGFFGPATKRAVIRFQEKYFDEILKPWGLLKGNGLVGPSTMKKINSIIGD